MKPKFILFVGVGWSATKPLYYTLSQIYNCLHGGIVREHHYLKIIQSLSSSNSIEDLDFVNKQVKKNKFEFFVFKKNNIFPEMYEYAKLFTEPPFTIKKYIKFYLNFYTYLQKNTKFQYVSDFSNSNMFLSKDFLKDFSVELLKHFDVKVLMIFRDPVRRYFSEHNFKYYITNPELQKKYSSASEYCLTTIHKSMDYVDLYNKFNLFFDCKQLVMEELWEGDGYELSNLSSFLNYKIEKLHFNVYCPDRGNKPVLHNKLPDQYSSDYEVLSEKLYYNLYNILESQYKNYYKKFNCTPLYWGNPINYSYNQSLPINFSL